MFVNGLSYHVEIEGAGTPVVLLHGFPDTSSLWRHQVPALAAAGFRTIAPDLRGRGRTEMPPDVDDYHVTAIVGDVVAILDELEVERAHVVGHDWGAGIAWVLASLQPERVDRLVAISVGFPGAVRPDLEALQKAWYQLIAIRPDAEELMQAGDWYLTRELLKDEPDLEDYIAELSRPGALKAGLDWYRANVSVERWTADGLGLPPVQAPTLGIFGSEDRYLTERAMLASEQKVAGEWRYERIEGAGHWIPTERPDQLAELLVHFLK